MKQIYKEKFAVDLLKYCKQIGILDNEIPRLIFNPREMEQAKNNK